MNTNNIESQTIDSAIAQQMESHELNEQASIKQAADTTKQRERRQASQINQSVNVWLKARRPLEDIISTKHHSDDFITIRAEYISVRLWLMCLFFAVSVPVFSFFDFYFLPNEQASYLLIARIGLSLMLLVMARFLNKNAKIQCVRVIMPLAFLVPMLFAITCMHILNTDAVTEIPAIFTMMPFLILAMLGLFPLTLCGGVFVIFAVLVPFLCHELLLSGHTIAETLNNLWLFCLFAGVSLWLQAAQLAMLMTLYRESTIDPLTNLMNRRALMRIAKQDKAVTANMSVLMMDLDRFKRINDTYGHAAGDKVLKAVAKQVKQELRQSDIVARYGGEEFIAILPELSLQQAKEVANRVLASVRSLAIPIGGGEQLSVTTSIGIAQRHDNEHIEALFNRADELLYQAKETGRNKIVANAA